MANNPPPRDPLRNETLRVPESERLKNPEPEALRYLRRTDGSTELQGAYRRYNDQGMIVYRWEGPVTMFNGHIIETVIDE